MRARISGLIGVMAVVLGSCKNDPTSSGSGTPSAVIANFSSLSLGGVGATGTFTASIVDQRLTPIAGTINVTACNPAIATVALDPSYQPVPNTSIRAIVTGTALNKTCVIATAAGLPPDTIQVVVLPLFLPSTVSTLTPKGGDTITITATNPLITFDTAALTVTFPGAQAGIILSKSSTSFRTLVPYSPPGKNDSLRLAGVNVTYANKDFKLPAQGILLQSGDVWAGDSSFATAPEIGTLIPAAAGDSSFVLFQTTPIANAAICGEGAIAAFGSSGPCMIFKVTVATADSLTFTLNWPSGDGGSNPDIDTYFCTGTTPSTCVDPGTFNFVGPGGSSGASSSDPEVITVKLAPGTYYYVAEYFAACDDSDPTKCSTLGAVNTYTLQINKH